MLRLLAAGGWAACLALALAGPLAAQSADPFQKVFGSAKVDTTAYAPSFLSQIGAGQIQRLVDTLRAQLGAYVASSGTPGDTTLTFSQGYAKAKYALDGSSRFVGLLFYSMQNDATTALLTRLLTLGKADAADFDTSFLSQVPVASLAGGIAQLKAQYGEFLSLEPRNGLYGVKFAKGPLLATIFLNASGKVSALRLLPDAPKTSSLDDALRRLRQLRGSLSYVILEGRTQRAALAADAPMSVGSTFKLSVLSALRQEIDGGKRHWPDVVRLREADKSLPSGRLQDWPSGTHLTLETLATFMISISDNTAADTLIRVLGRAAIEPYAYGNVPLLTTRNMFALKSKGAAALRAQWRTGSIALRRTLLAKLDALALPSILQADIQPADLDIDWHYSVSQLCRLMANVADLPLMSVNPGVALPSDWKHVAYKGGSDAGVINMTTWLTNAAGTTYCVSATLNNNEAAVDENAFAGAYSAVLDQLKE